MNKKFTLRLLFILASAILVFTVDSLSQCLQYLGQTPPGNLPIRLVPDSLGANSEWQYHGTPTFSPDDLQIIFNGNIGYADSVGFVIMDRDGTNLKLFLDGEDPVFSPDGSKIFYQDFIPPYSKGLYIMNVDGSQKKFLSLIPFQIQPNFSPDGSKIVFSNFINNSDIFLINVDESNLINLTNSPKTETFPVFSADGSKIIYVQYDTTSHSNRLMSMNINGNENKIIYEEISGFGMKIFN